MNLLKYLEIFLEEIEKVENKNDKNWEFRSLQTAASQKLVKDNWMQICEKVNNSEFHSVFPLEFSKSFDGHTLLVGDLNYIKNWTKKIIDIIRGESILKKCPSCGLEVKMNTSTCICGYRFL
ncbi:MAG: hypothetical protein INQ03_00770 [Candidatus Heimdallarchaeota archaeon]|nr:hypothetical protein [Candidatus Heimdallarchaeota archaeon]